MLSKNLLGAVFTCTLAFTCSFVFSTAQVQAASI